MCPLQDACGISYKYQLTRQALSCPYLDCSFWGFSVLFCFSFFSFPVLISSTHFCREVACPPGIGGGEVVGEKHLLKIPSSTLGVAKLPNSCRWLYSQFPCGHMAFRGLLILITASSLCLFKNQKADRLLMVYLY